MVGVTRSRAGVGVSHGAGRGVDRTPEDGVGGTPRDGERGAGDASREHDWWSRKHARRRILKHGCFLVGNRKLR